MKREKLVSVTAADCKWEFFTAGGKGGQNQNKTASACRVTHEPSGAVGESREHREQLLNKKAAFRKMIETKEFSRWIKLEIKRKTGQLALIEAEVERDLKRTIIEVKDEDGKWTKVKNEEIT